MTDFIAGRTAFARLPQTRRWLGWLHYRSFPVLPERMAFGAGLRGAMALVPFVIAGERLHQPLLAWSAFAAFWTCLGDCDGQLAVRRRSMVVFTACGAVVAAAFSGLAQAGPLVGAPALFALVLACGAMGQRHRAQDLTATLLAVVGAVALEQPIAIAAIPMVAAAFVAGGGLALGLLAGPWPVSAPPADCPAPGAGRTALLRRAIAVLAVYALAHWQHMPAIHWATMAALVVTHGETRTGGGNWPRASERMIGSLLGTAVALALLHIPAAAPVRYAEVYALAAATLALRKVNYTLFVCFLTPLFVLVVGMIMPGPGGATLAAARAADNLLGSLVAALGCEALLLVQPGRTTLVARAGPGLRSWRRR